MYERFSSLSTQTHNNIEIIAVDDGRMMVLLPSSVIWPKRIPMHCDSQSKRRVRLRSRYRRTQRQRLMDIYSWIPMIIYLDAVEICVDAQLLSRQTYTFPYTVVSQDGDFQFVEREDCHYGWLDAISASEIILTRHRFKLLLQNI